MAQAGDIREWRGHDVVDTGGRRIGTLEAVYVDTATDLPSFATVAVGAPLRRRLVFVPLADAVLGPGYVRVPYARKQVRTAPSIGGEGGLPAADEPVVFAHYDLPYATGAGGERRLARR